MSKTTKTVIIIAVIIIIIGVIMCSVALFFGGRGLLEHYEHYLRLGSPEYQQQEYSFDARDITTLEVATITDDVYLHLQTASDEIKVTCTDSQYYQYDVAVVGDTLRVEYQEKVRTDSIWERGFFWSEEARIDIWLPTEFLPQSNINLSLVSGDAIIDGLDGDTLAVESVSGDIEFYRCSFMNMTLDTVSGDIEGTILGNRGDYDIEYDSVSGRVEIGGPVEPGSAERQIWLNTTSGDIEINFIQSFTAASHQLICVA